MTATTQSTHPSKSLRVIRSVYLYLVAMIGLIVFVIGTVGIVNNVLRYEIFHADDYSYIAPRLIDPECGTLSDSTKVEACIQEMKIYQEEENNQRRRNDMARQYSVNIAQIVVGLPLWLFHWHIIQREAQRRHAGEESSQKKASRRSSSRKK